MATDPPETEYDESLIDEVQSYASTRMIEFLLAEMANAGRLNDRDRFDLLFGIIFEATYNAAWRLTRNPTIAEGRTAQTLLRAFRTQLQREAARASSPFPDPMPPDPMPDPPPNPHKEPIPDPPRPMPDPYPTPRPNRPRARPGG